MILFILLDNNYYYYIIREHMNLLVWREPNLCWQMSKRTALVWRMESHFPICQQRTPRIHVKRLLFLDTFSLNKRREKVLLTNILASTFFFSANSIP